MAFFCALARLLVIVLERGSKLKERLGFRRDNSEIVEGVTKMGLWVGFYRGKVMFWFAMVGERSKCWSKGGFDEVKMKKCNGLHATDTQVID